MLIVCPNIAIDHTVELSRLHPGTVQRTGPARSAAGGKGANVARAAAAVGGRPVVLAFLAESGGRYLAGLFADEDLLLLPVPIDGAVRSCTVLIETGVIETGLIEKTGERRVTLLNEPGAAVTETDWRTLLGALDPAARIVVGSGSLPPGAPVDGYARLVALVHERGGECAIDVGGPALRLAAEAGADLVCPNLAEATAVLDGADPAAVEEVDERGADVPDRALAAARRLVDLGAGNAAVTAGAMGVALVEHSYAATWLPTSPVTVRNPIGAGDSFLAGTMTAREQGADWVDAVRYGMATAGASVESDGAGVVDPDRARELLAVLTAAHQA